MAWSSNRFCDFGVALNPPVQGPQTSRNKGSASKFNPSATINSTTAVTKLESVRAGTTATIIGIVIAKESPKSIFSRKSPGTERFLLSFVIRDSPTYFANATCWGSENYIKDLARTFGIGDAVTISNAQVQTNPTDGSEEKFRVTTPLSFHLNLSENHSSVTLYNGLDLGSYASLQYIPTKPSSDFYTLEDVLANGQSLEGEHINLLAVVRKLGPGKDITTKAGRHTKRCELKLFDESCPSFPLVLWGEEIVDYALSWIPMETVLFVADVRMNFDNFRQSMLATSDSKTVFTPNPDTVEGQCLYQYAQTQSFSSDDDPSGAREQSDPPLDQIKEVVTIEEAVNRKASQNSDYVIIYGVITAFDLDSENTDKFFRKRCPKCKHIVTHDAGYQCINTECTQGALSMFNATGEITVGEPEKEFSLSTSIADHTGSITQCRFNGTVIENMLGWNPNDLVQLEAERRTDLKWNFLLERCKFYVKIIRSFQDQQKVSFRILSCSKADPAEVDRYLRAA